MRLKNNFTECKYFTYRSGVSVSELKEIFIPFYWFIGVHKSLFSISTECDKRIIAARIKNKQDIQEV